METKESRELALYTINTGEIYRGVTKSTIFNLSQKMKKGKFNNEFAIKAFEHIAEYGAKMYQKEFGSPSSPWYKMFSAADRHEAAVEMLDHYMEEITEKSKEENSK